MTRVKNETGEEVSERQIKAVLPNLSFGGQSDLTEFGYPPLVETEPPEPQEGMRAVRGPNELIGGQWHQTWVQEIIPAPSVPDVIDAAQGTFVLIEMDLWDSVLAYIAAIPSKKKREQAETAVMRTQRWRRDSATLIQMATALGITEQQMDQMFIAADKVVF